MVGQNIRRIRMERCMTQTTLAEKTGLSRITIVRFEKDKLKPSLNTLERIAKVLNVTSAELLTSYKEAK